MIIKLHPAKQKAMSHSYVRFQYKTQQRQRYKSPCAKREKGRQVPPATPKQLREVKPPHIRHDAETHLTVRCAACHLTVLVCCALRDAQRFKGPPLGEETRVTFGFLLKYKFRAGGQKKCCWA